MKTRSVLVWTEGLSASKCTRFQNALVWTGPSAQNVHLDKFKSVYDN